MTFNCSDKRVAVLIFFFTGLICISTIIAADAKEELIHKLEYARGMPGPPMPGDVFIQGDVTDKNGKEIENVKVRITWTGKNVTLETDKYGDYYTFSPLTVENGTIIRIFVSHPYYNTEVKEIVIDKIQPYNTVNFELEPIKVTSGFTAIFTFVVLLMMRRLLNEL